jgi:nucleoside-diphosphate-sugar epimerase
MRIVVTGGAGFIGSARRPLLAKRDTGVRRDVSKTRL